MTKPGSRQIILLAHGSRDPRWCKTFEEGLVAINRHLASDAQLAYMEMASPSLETVIANSHLRGVRHVDILPLFFAEGRHLLHDVPKMIADLEQVYTGMSINLRGAVGKQEIFWEALGIMISTNIDQHNAMENGSREAFEQQH